MAVTSSATDPCLISLHRNQPEFARHSGALQAHASG